MQDQLTGEDAHGGVEPAARGISGPGDFARAVGSPHLINSKLKPPLCASACVRRDDLLSRLEAASRRKLALLSAPIGSGKTTLLTQWHGQSIGRRSIAWLSLDEQDNDPVRFFSYLIGAVRSAVAGFDAYIAGRRGEDPRLVDSAAAMLSQRLNALDRDLAIVIDDFQSLTSPLLARAFDFLLRRSPGNVHWVVSGRCLPELSIGSLRLNDQLTTFGVDDLRFDSALIVDLSAHRPAE